MPQYVPYFPKLIIQLGIILYFRFNFFNIEVVVVETVSSIPQRVFSYHRHRSFTSEKRDERLLRQNIIQGNEKKFNNSTETTNIITYINIVHLLQGAKK